MTRGLAASAQQQTANAASSQAGSMKYSINGTTISGGGVTYGKGTNKCNELACDAVQSGSRCILLLLPIQSREAAELQVSWFDSNATSTRGVICMKGFSSADGFSKKQAVFTRKRAMLLLTAVLCLCLGLRAYSQYMARQALSLLAETRLIEIGSDGQSVSRLIGRYGVIKCNTSVSGSKNGCTNGAECQQNGADMNDYTCEIRLSPFQIFSIDSSKTSRMRGAIAFFMVYVPKYLRDLIGLRNWLVDATVQIRNKGVASVSGSAFVEGRNEWLGNSWRLSSSVVGDDQASTAYSVEMTHLQLSENGGLAVEEFFTRSATREQLQVSYDLNSRCFVSLTSCVSLSDLKPSLFEYLRGHPEIRTNFDVNEYLK